MFQTNTVQESCNSILQHLRASSLNFRIEETPYSIFMAVRKSFSKKMSSAPSLSLIVSNNISDFRPELYQLKAENLDLRAKNHDLEKANAAIARNFEEEALECEAFNVDLVDTQHEIAKIQSKLSMAGLSLND